MSDVELTYKDESKVWIRADHSTRAELSDVLTFEVPGARYTPKFKAGWWDGKIRLFNENAQSVNAGLIPEIAKFCRDAGYRMKADSQVIGLFKNSSYSMEALDSWLDSLHITSKEGEVIQLHDHQREAIHACIAQKRLTLLSPTSSGKSLIIYCVSRWLTEMQDLAGKILIVVPTTGLVEQLHDDIMDYSSSDSSLPSDFGVHRIYAGKDKDSGSRIFVSTWHSIYKLPQEWFGDFSGVVIDECHNAKGPSLQGVLEKCTNAEFRLGTTGTLDGSKVNALVIKAALGPISKFVSTKELMESGIVAQLKIRNVIFSHTADERSMVTKMEYKDELSYIEGHQKRNEAISDLVKKMPGNVLCLFTKKAHGRKIAEALKNCGKKVYLLNGDNPVEERSMVKRLLEAAEEEIVLVASYGIFSTGESVKNIQHVVFASPVKSRIRVLQSIGRGLRVSATKKSVFLWDLVDDFSTRTKDGSEKKANITLKHFRERCKIYDSEEFDYETKTYDLFSATIDTE